MEREMYLLDIHSEITMTSKNRSDGKSIIIRLVLVGLVFGFAFGGNFLLAYLGIPFLGFVAGLLIGFWIALIIWNKIVEREEAIIENPDENKALKFFKITLGREEFVKDVPIIEYTNGDKAIILSIVMGNQTLPGKQIVQGFYDVLFNTCHKNHIKFKIFTTMEEWEDSDLHNSLLKTYGNIYDQKLKSVLFESINVQSEDFSKSKIIQTNIIFMDRDYTLSKLHTVIDIIETFKNNDMKLSSIRSMRWNTQEQVVRLFCRFLGIKLIDSSPLADKTNVFLDTKALVRPFDPDLFFTSPRLTSHLTNTYASRIRVPITAKRS